MARAATACSLAAGCVVEIPLCNLGRAPLAYRYMVRLCSLAWRIDLAVYPAFAVRYFPSLGAVCGGA